MTEVDLRELRRVWMNPAALSPWTDRETAAADVLRLVDHGLLALRRLRVLAEDVERLKPLAIRCDEHEDAESGCAECYRLEIRRLAARVMELEIERRRLLEVARLQAL